MFVEGFAPLLAEVAAAGIEHVIIGGVAVNLLGYIRATADADVLVPDSRENAQRIRDLLDRVGATRPGGGEFFDAQFRGGAHIRAVTPLGTIDFIAEGESPITYAEVRSAASADAIGEVTVALVSVSHLAYLKRLADRPKDREDLAVLQRIHGPIPDPS